jgi:hypothetical protein
MDLPLPEAPSDESGSRKAPLSPDEGKAIGSVSARKFIEFVNKYEYT